MHFLSKKPAAMPALSGGNPGQQLIKGEPVHVTAQKIPIPDSAATAGKAPEPSGTVKLNPFGSHRHAHRR